MHGQPYQEIHTVHGRPALHSWRAWTFSFLLLWQLVLQDPLWLVSGTCVPTGYAARSYAGRCGHWGSRGATVAASTLIGGRQ